MKYTIRDGTFHGYPVDADQLLDTLNGMQAVVRARCHVVPMGEAIPADEMLERLRRAARAEMVTIPPEERDTLPPGAPCDVDEEVAPI